MKTTKTTLIAITALFTLGSLFTSCSKEEGCTDPAATNFNVEAEKDDGSCQYAVIETPEEEHEESHIVVNFNHHFDGVPVTMNNFNQFNYVTANNDTISISKLRYMIDEFKLYSVNGDSTILSAYQLIDLTNSTTMSVALDEVNWGSYAAIGFNFGFDTVKNSGNYIDLNSASWNVPMMMGGGYHCMQFEGKYKMAGNDSNYAYHQVPRTRMNMMSAFEDNHIAVRLAGISLNEHNVTINIDMNIAEWFRSPNTWNLNTYHSSLMGNYTAQKMMSANGQNVFSVNSIFQRK